jgi:hypothetical protein
MRNLLPLLTSCALVAISGCGKPVVTDTGYTGTWSRGSERLSSTLSIVRDGDGYLFRLALASDGGGRLVECDWEGRCEEIMGEEKTGEYRFTTRVHPETGHLIVEYVYRSELPGVADSSYVDELVLEPGGLALKIYTLERDGEPIPVQARPTRKFQKVADKVAMPPARRAG